MTVRELVAWLAEEDLDATVVLELQDDNHFTRDELSEMHYEYDGNAVILSNHLP